MPSPSFIQNFKPTGDTSSISATTTTGNVEIVSTVNPSDCLVLNTHTAIVYVKFGGESVEVTAATGIPIPANGWIVLHKGQAQYAAVLAASTSGTVFFTPGIGS